MIRITKIADQIVLHGQNVKPIEACGYLAGKDSAVLKAYPMTNIDHSPDHFTLDPREQLQTIKEARREGLDVIAVYHTHPASPARPSEEDIRLAYDADITYVIVSLVYDRPQIKAYKIKANNVTSEPIEEIADDL